MRRDTAGHETGHGHQDSPDDEGNVLWGALARVPGFARSDLDTAVNDTPGQPAGTLTLRRGSDAIAYLSVSTHGRPRHVRWPPSLSRPARREPVHQRAGAV